MGLLPAQHVVQPVDFTWHRGIDDKERKEGRGKNEERRRRRRKGEGEGGGKRKKKREGGRSLVGGQAPMALQQGLSAAAEKMGQRQEGEGRVAREFWEPYSMEKIETGEEEEEGKEEEEEKEKTRLSPKQIGNQSNFKKREEKELTRGCQRWVVAGVNGLRWIGKVTGEPI